jgi:chemotaxis protein methyltransferase WspC
MTPLERIGELLRTRIGFDVGAIGARALGHAVRGRVRERGLADADAYLTALGDDATEWEELVEAIVVPETWFFRDREPFALLARFAGRHWRQRGRHDRVNVLSLPCASGEEAWSIAIVLAAAGVAPEAFRVDGVDLSRRALKQAAAGRYAARALRGRHPPAAWTRYLHELPDGRLAVDQALHASLRFKHGNVVDAGTLLAGRHYDAIFSRNLLIYCDRPTRAAALATFTDLLRPDGLLVLGHAEPLPEGTQGFVREGPAGAFAWRRTDVVKGNATRFYDSLSREGEGRGEGDQMSGRLIRAGKSLIKSDRPHPNPLALGRGSRPLKTPSVGGGNPPPVDVLATARACADRGALREAAELLVQRLAAVPDDSEAHALLGTVRAAQSRDGEAVEHLRRALYLAPRHEQALLHLAMLLERRGERQAAARLRARARPQHETQ